MKTVVCPIALSAQKSPHTTAILTDSGSVSFLEMHEKVHSLTLALTRQKVGEGTRVSFVAKPSLATVLLFIALFRLRAIACPLNPKLPARQIPPSLNDLESTHFYSPEDLPWQVQIPSSTLPELSLSSLATFLFTSGSSAKPKIACHSFGNHYFNALGAIGPLELDENSLYLLSLPLFHVSGIAILFRSLFAKTPLLLSSFSLEETLLHYPVTHLSLVPTQLYRLLNNPNSVNPPPSLRCALLGGAPTPISLLQKACKWPIQTSYGMTEMSSMIALQGKVLPFRDVKVEKGEIFVRGNTLFQGYLHEHLIESQAWFATKDCGYFEQDLLVITGRKDRQFISGGENIQPEEIERALYSLPFIAKARVLPKEDPEFGNRACAYIESTSYDLNEIRSALAPLLPSFKLPVEVHPFEGIQEKDF